MVAAYRVSILQRDTYDDATRVGEFRKLFAERDVASFSPIAQMDDRSDLTTQRGDTRTRGARGRAN